MPPPLSVMNEEVRSRPAESERLKLWVRGSLIGLALGLVAVFSVACWLDPYDRDGKPMEMAVHQQLGLPPCTFYTYSSGIPCPSCGMTTSFALLLHGDVWNSLQANFVGTMLACLGLILIPWSLASCLQGRLLFVRSGELALARIVLVFVALMVARWAVVLACHRG